MNRNLLLVCLFFLFSLSAFSQKAFESSSASNIISNDSFGVTKSYQGKSAVKLYPNPSYGKLSVSSTTLTPLHFYIFDLDGTLIYQAVLNSKEKKMIENLKKGTYLYDVFEKDESIEEGKIIIK